MRLSSEFARLRESFTLKMHSRLSNVTVQMLLYLYVNLRLMNKLTSEMGNFFTDTMRNSNSHEFEEMVDPITCTPNEEPKENIVEIDETFSEISEKESSVTTVFSWSNFSVQNRGSAATSGAKRHKVDSSVVVIDSPQESPRKEDKSSESSCV